MLQTSRLIKTLEFGVHQINVVEQIDEDDIFFDLFDAQTGQCINDHILFSDEPGDTFDELPMQLQSLLEKHYLLTIQSLKFTSSEKNSVVFLKP